MTHKRSITLTQGIALYMGAVLGSGILILPGYTADAAGPASIVSWIIITLLSIPIAYTFARLALKYENFGGIATIVQHAFGTYWSAIVGWFFYAWVATGQAVVGLTGAAYLVEALQLSEPFLYLFAFMFLLLAMVSNFFGMRISGLFSLVLSGAVLLLLIVTIIVALPQMESIHFTPFVTHGFSGIGSACVLIFWAFFGWESITHLVPEFKNPQRDVMRSMWFSVCIIGIVYILLSIVTIGTHTYGDISAQAPLSLLMSKTIGVSAGAAAAMVACIVCIGTLNVYLASSSRLGFALAKERKLPGWFAGMSRKGFPYRSALFLFLTNTATLLFSYYYSVPVDRLILIPTTLGILVYIIASGACVKLLWHDPIGRISAMLALGCCLAIAPFSTSYLMAPLAVGITCVVYLWWTRRKIRD